MFSTNGVPPNDRAVPNGVGQAWITVSIYKDQPFEILALGLERDVLSHTHHPARQPTARKRILKPASDSCQAPFFLTK